MLGATFFCQYHTDPTIQNYKKKLHVNDLEAMHSDINSVTTCQTRFKGHLSAQLGGNAWKIAYF